MYGTDHRWWAHHISDIARDFDGQCWTQEVQWPEKQPPEAWGIKCLKSDTQARGLSTDPDKIHTGMNSGYAAINLAMNQLAAQRILLLGYDMKMRGSQRHWFGAHPEGMEVQSNYQDFATRFASINPADYGIEIWNVTRDTALHCFPIYDLDDVAGALR